MIVCSISWGMTSCVTLAARRYRRLLIQWKFGANSSSLWRLKRFGWCVIIETIYVVVSTLCWRLPDGVLVHMRYMIYRELLATTVLLLSLLSSFQHSSDPEDCVVIVVAVWWPSGTFVMFWRVYIVSKRWCETTYYRFIECRWLENVWREKRLVNVRIVEPTVVFNQCDFESSWNLWGLRVRYDQYLLLPFHKRPFVNF